MRCALILAVVLHAGCSVVGVTGPPSRPTEPIQCTDALWLPLADVVGGVAVWGVIGLAMFSGFQSETEATPATAQLKAAAIGFGAALPWLLSATYGVVQTRRCRRLKDSRRSR